MLTDASTSNFHFTSDSLQEPMDKDSKTTVPSVCSTPVAVEVGVPLW